MPFNLRKLFRKETPSLEEIVELKCADPHCHSPITEDKMFYDKKNHKIYHSGECYQTAYCRGAPTSQYIAERIPDFEQITRKQAIKLYKTGQVAKYNADKK